MFAILAEDGSDAEALTVIVRRHYGNESLPIKKKGYGGCAELRRKGARDIQTWLKNGVSRFIICHDADFNNPVDVYQKVLNLVVRPAKAENKSCITVPVQELEAWLIADERAIQAVIPSFSFKGHANPECISSPKEWLVNCSKAANGKPLYSPATFNPAVARGIRIPVVAKKCPSFRSFINQLDTLSAPG